MTTITSIHSHIARTCVSDGCQTVTRHGERRALCEACRALERTEREKSAVDEMIWDADSDMIVVQGEMDEGRTIPTRNALLIPEYDGTGSMHTTHITREENAYLRNGSFKEAGREKVGMKTKGHPGQNFSSSLASRNTRLGTERKAFIIKQTPLPHPTEGLRIPSEHNPLPNPHTKQDLHTLLRNLTPSTRGPPLHSIIRLCKRQGCAAILTPNKDGQGATYCRRCRESGLAPPEEGGVSSSSVTPSSTPPPPPVMVERTIHPSSSSRGHPVDRMPSVPERTKRKRTHRSIPISSHVRGESTRHRTSIPSSSSSMPTPPEYPFPGSSHPDSRAERNDQMFATGEPVDVLRASVRGNATPATSRNDEVYPTSPIRVPTRRLTFKPLPVFQPRFRYHPPKNPYPFPPFYEHDLPMAAPPAPLVTQSMRAPPSFVSGGKPILLEGQRGSGSKRRMKDRMGERGGDERDERETLISSRCSSASSRPGSGSGTPELAFQLGVMLSGPEHDDDVDNDMVVDSEQPSLVERAQEIGEAPRFVGGGGGGDLVDAVGKAVSDVLSSIASSAPAKTELQELILEYPSLAELELAYPEFQASQGPESLNDEEFLSNEMDASDVGQDRTEIVEMRRVGSEGVYDGVGEAEVGRDEGAFLNPPTVVLSQAQTSGLAPIVRETEPTRKTKHNLYPIIPPQGNPYPIIPHNYSNYLSHSYRPPYPHPNSNSAHSLFTCEPLVHAISRPRSRVDAHEVHPNPRRLPSGERRRRSRQSTEFDSERIEAQIRARAQAHANPDSVVNHGVVTEVYPHESSRELSATPSSTSFGPPEAQEVSPSDFVQDAAMADPVPRELSAAPSLTSFDPPEAQAFSPSEFAQDPDILEPADIPGTTHSHGPLSVHIPVPLEVRPNFVPRGCSTPGCNGIINAESVARRCIGCVRRRWNERLQHGAVDSFGGEGEEGGGENKKKRKSVTWADWCEDEVQQDEDQEGESEEEGGGGGESEIEDGCVPGWDSDLSELTESEEDSGEDSDEVVEENEVLNGELDFVNAEGGKESSLALKRKSLDEGEAERVKNTLKFIFNADRSHVSIVGDGVEKQIPFNPSESTETEVGDDGLEASDNDDSDDLEGSDENTGSSSDSGSTDEESDSSVEEPLVELFRSKSGSVATISSSLDDSANADVIAGPTTALPTSLHVAKQTTKDAQNTSSKTLATGSSPSIRVHPVSSLSSSPKSVSGSSSDKMPAFVPQASTSQRHGAQISDGPPPGFSDVRCTIKSCSKYLPLGYGWKCCPQCRVHHREYQRKRLGCEAKYQERSDGMTGTVPYGAPFNTADISRTNAFSKGLAGSHKLVDPEGFLVDGARICTIRGCKHIIPNVQEYKWKMCFPCRVRTTRTRKIREAKAERLAKAANGLLEEDREPSAERLLQSVSPDGDLPKQDPERAVNGRCVNTDCGMTLRPKNQEGSRILPDSSDLSSKICEQCQWRKLAPEVKRITIVGVHQRVKIVPIRNHSFPENGPASSNPSLPRKSALRQTALPVPPPKPYQPTPYPEYQCLSRLLVDFQRLFYHFLEAQSFYTLFRQRRRHHVTPPIKSKFGFDGEYSVVAKDFELLERREEVEMTVTSLVQEIERVAQLKFFSDSRVTESAYGGIITRLACLHQVVMPYPAHNRTDEHKAQPIRKNMTGELEIVVLPVSSHRYLPGQRTVVRFRLIG